MLKDLVKRTLGEQPNIGQSLIIGIVTTVVTTVLIGALGLLVGLFSFSDNIPGWGVVLIASATLGVGLYAGISLARWIYEVRIEAMEKEVGVERQKRELIQPAADAFLRASMYEELNVRILEDCLNGDVSLAGFPDQMPESIEELLCNAVEAVIKEAADLDVYASLWVEQRRRIRADKFQIALAPSHREHEVKQFSLKIPNSWLDHAQQNQIQRPSERLRRIDDLAETGFIGHDLDVFRDLGYRSLRVITFRVGDDIGRLLYLCGAPRAFSPVENRFLLLLAFAVNFASRHQPASPEPSA